MFLSCFERVVSGDQEKRGGLAAEVRVGEHPRGPVGDVVEPAAEPELPQLRANLRISKYNIVLIFCKILKMLFKFNQTPCDNEKWVHATWGAFPCFMP